MDDRHDEIFKALADPNRRRILAALCNEPMIAGDLGRLVSLAPNAVSFHLKLLQEARLVTVQRQGRFLWYRVDRAVLDEWRSYAHALFEAPAGAKSIETHASRPPEYPPPAELKSAARSPSAQPAETQPVTCRDGSVDRENAAGDIDEKLPAELL
ncbi:MAG: ArsR/SmtB family transcription factor [Phycisphaerae bacterium]